MPIARAAPNSTARKTSIPHQQQQPTPTSTSTSTSQLPPHITAALSTHLSTAGLPPNPTFLNTLAASLRPTTPLPALKQTALFRLLAADLTSTLDRTRAGRLPADIADAGATVAERRLEGPAPVPVQVLEIWDVGRSVWAQVEALEERERGALRQGMQVVRVTEEDEAEGDGPAARGVAAAAAGKGPWKVLLVDAWGTRVWGLCLEEVEGVGGEMSVGAKMLLLPGCVVARGVVLLEGRSVKVLGGKVEAWEKAWREGLKERLRQRAEKGG